jgi:DNA-binding response OmpR family regulator
MKNILLVDDEPHVLRVLKLSLEREGYAVEVCATGREALKRVDSNYPDVLITDIQMPQMDGRELCQAIQQQIPDRKFVIYILTSRTEIEHRDWSRNIDNLEFMEKPVSIRDLVDRLETQFPKSANGWA